MAKKKMSSKKSVVKKMPVKKKTAKKTVKKSAKKKSLKKVVKKTSGKKKVTKKFIKKTTKKAIKKVVKKIPAKKKIVKKSIKKSVKKVAAKKIIKKLVKKEVKKSPIKKGVVKKTIKRKSSLIKQNKKTVEQPSPVLASIHAEAPPDVLEAEARYEFNDSYELPNEYEDTRITLLARDPFWLHVYWDVSQESINKLWEELGDELNYSNHIIRVYDVSLIEFNGSNANNWFDVDVGPYARSRYINLWNDNSSYCAEYGVRARDGRFIMVARSNYVTTPRSVMSYRSDLIWMEVEDHKSSGPFINLSFRQGKGGPWVPGKRKLFLSDEEVRQYYEKYFHFLKQILANRLVEDLQVEFEKHNKTSQGLEGVKIEDVDFYYDEELFEYLPDEITQHFSIGSSDSLVLKRKEKRRIRRYGGLAPDQFEGQSGGASEQLGGASEMHSAALQDLSKDARKFFFEIGTELIVYGRSEPDAKVTMDGRPIQLRPDGTFSMRFMLGDGEIPLKFLAQSSNKIDKKRIETSVIRTPTKYT